MTRLSLHEARSARDIAREQVDQRVEQVREDLSARGIGGRIIDSAAEQAVKTANETVAIARESKGVIAGTVAVLALWAFRRPLRDEAERLMNLIKDKFDE